MFLFEILFLLLKSEFYKNFENSINCLSIAIAFRVMTNK